MTRSKINAFFEEFPFLRSFFYKSDVDEVHVSRVNEDVMGEVPQKIAFDVGLLYTEEDSRWKRLILLDGSGHEVAEVGVVPVKAVWYRPSTWDGKGHFNETVSDLMVRLGDRAKEVHAILKSEPELADCSTGWRYRLTLLKSPKEFTIQGWMEELHRRNRAEVQEAVAQVDNV